MAASHDRQNEEVDVLQAELVTVEVKIAQLLVKRVQLNESIAAAKHRAEEIDLQLEQEQYNRKERAWHFILLDANATRIKVKDVVRQLNLENLSLALSNL